MGRNIADDLVVFQLPVVAFLASLAFTSRRVLRTSQFSLLGLAWIAHLLMLVYNIYFSRYALWGVLPPASELLQALQSYLFAGAGITIYLETRDFPKPPSQILTQLGVAVILAIVAAWMLTGVFGLTGRLGQYFLAPFTVAGFFWLAAGLRVTVKKRKLSGNVLVLLGIAGALCLAIIQPVGSFLLTEPDRRLLVVVYIGAVLSKIMLLIGNLALINIVAGEVLKEEASVREATRSLGQIAHELGTPVAEMSIHIKQLLEASDRRFRDERLIALQYTAERIRAIVDAAWALQKVGWVPGFGGSSAGWDEASRQRGVYNLNSLVQTAIMAIKATRDEKLQFRLDYLADCVIVCVDTEIIQIVINILRNCCDAMPAGSGLISISTCREEEGDGTAQQSSKFSSRKQGIDRTVVALRISDDGEGISERDRHRVFEEGFSTRGAGRGWGLSVAKLLTEKNQGSIFISKSREGCGTEVVLRFPSGPERSAYGEGIV